jgi:hypothetical protein
MCTPHEERGFGRHVHGFSEFLSALLRSRSDVRRGFSDLSKRTFTGPLSAVIPYKNSLVYLYAPTCPDSPTARQPATARQCLTRQDTSMVTA